jgi:hypothetical protein
MNRSNCFFAQKIFIILMDVFNSEILAYKTNHTKCIIMNKLAIIILTLMVCNQAFTQQTDIKWSPFGDKEKKEALIVAEKFISAYVNSDFQAIQNYIPANEINFGGDIWLTQQNFIQMIGQLRGKDQLLVGKIEAYTMDDSEKNPDLKKETLRIYRMFSNLSVFITAEIKDKEKNTSKSVFLNMSIDNNNNWVVSSFLDPSIGMAANTGVPKDRFRSESYDSLNFEILIPNEFSQAQRNGTQTTYLMPGNTSHDAAIQIDNYELKAPVNILSYNWVVYLTSQYDHSDILIKYMPYGYKYEYTLKDSNGNLNKGITTAFVSKNRFVCVQYFSFMETYNKIWTDIDLMIRKIKIRQTE